MAIKILDAMARLDDAEAMGRLLAPIPDSDQLRPMLVPGYSGRSQRYFREMLKGLYIAADGVTVACLTVTGITLEQGATIAAECDAIAQWTAAAFNQAVERALGIQSERVQ
jgi:hypothetical protein